jgi:U3 small nucleolar RNA-associated protein 6
MNVEALFRKRVKRLGIRTRMHYGTRRIFFILDRATRRFPGYIPLWMQYIEFAKKEKASTVLVKAFASALKLHPTQPELWMYAARHAVEVNQDIAEGRGYMQRGLRFCKKSREMWLEYAKLEMVFVAKVFMRRTVLGIDKVHTKQDDLAKSNEDENMIALPEITGEELEGRKTDKSLDTMALENADTNPALNGALAIAIFDQAMEELPLDLSFAGRFYNLFSRFTQLKCCTRLLEHVVKYMLGVAPNDPISLWMGVQLPIEGLCATDPAFPGRLATTLSNMETALQTTSQPGRAVSVFYVSL